MILTFTSIMIDCDGKGSSIEYTLGIAYVGVGMMLNWNVLTM